MDISFSSYPPPRQRGVPRCGHFVRSHVRICNLLLVLLLLLFPLTFLSLRVTFLRMFLQLLFLQIQLLLLLFLLNFLECQAADEAAFQVSASLGVVTDAVRPPAEGWGMDDFLPIFATSFQTQSGALSDTSVFSAAAWLGCSTAFLT